MATLVLSTLGRIAGNFVAGQVGGVIGSGIGLVVGSKIDSKLFGENSKNAGNKFILSNIAEYGEMIPVMYGRMRVEGKIIWAAPIREVVLSDSVKYYATFAMILCEGCVDYLHKIWADAILLDKTQLRYRFYPGDNNQKPDPLILSYEKIAPAYRGFSYVVIEEFPVSDFGNRIPSLSFEVERNIRFSVCDKITALNLLPGSGECVYDTVIQGKCYGEFSDNKWYRLGYKSRVNNNSESDVCDCVLSLNQMNRELKNVKWVSLTVCWFTDNLDIKYCDIYPAVEYNNKFTTPDNWNVAGISRVNAKQVSRDKDNRPLFGGTPGDVSVIRCISKLKESGYKVIVYPLLMVDMKNKPWRGRITGDIAFLDKFFNLYNKYILHYARLTKDVADGFIIGSEMKGITSLQNEHDLSFPGVVNFINLAEQVRGILGSFKIITYAADWSEYHSVNGWYNMDGLWSSPYIDVVGIDAYFPLADEPQPKNGFTKDQIINGWSSGEGWDYYYNDQGDRIYYTDVAFAWKNIEAWWSSYHYNPGQLLTSWVPKLKHIWFTEFNCASVDGAINQPNIFFDPQSIEGGLPKYSKGVVDFCIQRNCIEATLDKWSGSDMVTNIFIWGWDLRPFPFFPDRMDMWSDGYLWTYGHWINGKVNCCSLAGMILDVARKFNLNVDVSGINGIVSGYIIHYRQTMKDVFEIIKLSYGLVIKESFDDMVFLKRNREDQVVAINQNDLVFVNYFVSESYIQNYYKSVKINFINRISNYNPCSVTLERGNAKLNKILDLSLPVVMSTGEAENCVAGLIRDIQRNTGYYRFALPLKYLYLEPLDYIKLNDQVFVISDLLVKGNIEVGCVEAGLSDISFTDYNTVVDESNFINNPLCVKFTDVDFTVIELPPVKQRSVLYIVPLVEYKDWPGGMLYISCDNKENFRYLKSLSPEVIYGVIINKTGVGSNCLADLKNEIYVCLSVGELDGVNNDGLYNNVNLALIGDELIGFKDVELIDGYKYKLKHLTRGRYGTRVKNHDPGERFVFINYNLGIEYTISDVGSYVHFKLVTGSVSDGITVPFQIRGLFFKPFAPVSLSVKKLADKHLYISWIRCTRIGGEWRDYVDVPLSEEEESYDVEIYDAENRLTETANVKGVTYYSSGQIPSGAVSVTVYQLSSATGRGYPCSVSVLI